MPGQPRMTRNRLLVFIALVQSMSLAGASVPVRDMDISVRRGRCLWGVLDQIRSRFSIGELCCSFAARLALYKLGCARALPGCRGVDGSAEFSFSRGSLLLDCFRNY